MITSLLLSVMGSKVGKSSIADEIQSKQKAAPTTTVDPFKAVKDAQQQGMPAQATPAANAPATQQQAAPAATDQKAPQSAPAKKP
jgi:hypothetical protein